MAEAPSWANVLHHRKDKGKLSYFWEHVYLKAKSGPNLGGVVNPDSGVAILDPEMQNDNQSAPVR